MALPRAAKWLFAILFALVSLLGIVVFLLVSVPAPVERWLQQKVEIALRQRYGREVRLENLQVSVIPVFRVTGDNFVLPSRRGDGIPPFITIQHFRAEASALQLLRKPLHVSWVKLDGLVIQIPPKQPAAPPSQADSKPRSRFASFVIDRVDADGTRLLILPKQAVKEPMEWDLRALHLTSAGIGQPMHFTAQLTNPKPPGIIETSGSFGPWNQDEPSDTAVSGQYSFKDADLSIFSGISGTLASVGEYSGVLNNIVVDGSCEVPDFKLDSSGRALHLSTQYHAIVDGTNGNTYLQPVNAQFLDSRVVARGAVAAEPGNQGKTITLDIEIQQSKVEDVLDLASSASPPMLTGNIAVKAKLSIAPGSQPVLNKIELAGTFSLGDVRFAAGKASETVAALSRRAQGKPDDSSIKDVRAKMSGAFVLRDSTLTLRQLKFEVPGVNVSASGRYGLISNAIDFSGEVFLQAHVSDTMTGAPRLLLKPVDPLFARHQAGTYLPVTVTGARSSPQIKLDLKRVF